MEVDGITRIYLGGTDSAKSHDKGQGNTLVFPERGERITGNDASEVRRHCDVVVVHGSVWNVPGRSNAENYYCSIDGKHAFTIDGLGWAWAESYAKLAAEVERLTGKTGLTIIVP